MLLREVWVWEDPNGQSSFLDLRKPQWSDVAEIWLPSPQAVDICSFTFHVLTGYEVRRNPQGIEITAELVRRLRKPPRERSKKIGSTRRKRPNR